MSTLALSSCFPVALPTAGATAGNRREDPIRETVQLALASVRDERKAAERRRESRYPYPYPVHLTPVARDGQADVEETIVVLGKHLSEHGLDFYHREPLPHRRVIASLPDGENRWIGLLLDLTWCRFSRHGWYDNGGRFLSVASSPLG
jgi:hypothetical protein